MDSDQLGDAICSEQKGKADKYNKSQYCHLFFQNRNDFLYTFSFSSG